MIEVVNRQRKLKIDSQDFLRFAERAIEKIPEAAEQSLTIAFVSDKKMRELNGFFRGVKKTTDVLSFHTDEDEFQANENYLGDIVISLEQAARQASENNLELETEIKQLILHGILHLCGYDHETDDGEMNRKEIKLRDKLDID